MPRWLPYKKSYEGSFRFARWITSSFASDWSTRASILREMEAAPFGASGLREMEAALFGASGLREMEAALFGVSSDSEVRLQEA